jgi:hypothetical protein
MNVNDRSLIVLTQKSKTWLRARIMGFGRIFQIFHSFVTKKKKRFFFGEEKIFFSPFFHFFPLFLPFFPKSRVSFTHPQSPREARKPRIGAGFQAI